MSSMQGINLTGGCAKCGGKRWEYFENTSDEFIQEFRCIELTCGYQDLRYSDGQFISHKTPEEVQEFLEDYDLLEEKEEEEYSLWFKLLVFYLLRDLTNESFLEDLFL